MIRIGNITLNSKPNTPEITQGICSVCNEEAELIPIDRSFGDSFGTVTDWAVGTQCCEASLKEETD